MKDRALKPALKLWAAAALLAGSLALTSQAHADYLPAQSPFMDGLPVQCLIESGTRASLFNRPIVAWGTSLQVDSLSFASAGRLSIRLTDLEFPLPLESLSVLVTDLNGLTQRLDGPGDLLIDLAGPARLFVAVFARTQDRHTPGLYALTSNFAPVPLPAAAWLLLSGLGGLFWLRRKRS
jgi:hypothetical protein